jgi:integrase
MGASRLKPLTVKEVEKLTATNPTSIKHRSLGGVPGFVLVHTPAGHMSYGLIYRSSKGERKKLTLGSAKFLTLADARKLAGQYRSSIEAGGDPHGQKIEERRQIKVQRDQELAQKQLDVELLWMKYMQLAAAHLRSKGEKDRVFRRYILPSVQGMAVTQITRAHTLAIIDALVADEKRRMADKVRQEGAAFFQWLIEREHVDRNVFAGLRKATFGKTIRTRVLSDDEVREIWVASEPEGRWGLWIRLLILTGCRNMEVRGARWSELDLEARVWTIPAERSKNARPHAVYLTDAMLDIIAHIPRFKDVDLVFPAVGNDEQPMSGDQKVKDRIDERIRKAFRAAGSKEPDNWRLHDFRRTIATGLQRLGFRPDIADQVIGHVGSTRMGAAAHYLHHQYFDERKDALEVWSAHITGVIAVRSTEAQSPNQKRSVPSSGFTLMPM